MNQGMLLPTAAQASFFRATHGRTSKFFLRFRGLKHATEPTSRWSIAKQRETGLVPKHGEMRSGFQDVGSIYFPQASTREPKDLARPPKGFLRHQEAVVLNSEARKGKSGGRSAGPKGLVAPLCRTFVHIAGAGKYIQFSVAGVSCRSR